MATLRINPDKLSLLSINRLSQALEQRGSETICHLGVEGVTTGVVGVPVFQPCVASRRQWNNTGHNNRDKFICFSEVLVHMQVGGASNASLKARLAVHRNDLKDWIFNGLRPALWTIPLKPLRKIPQFFCKP